ncbi:MAG TPA: PP2C family protein-serine/threonine phosphatase [Solirubrobacterales bacterium]|nr:PP2C family protein-serine/threonine phosphatase [Solirubrobacterales bacterium]
MVGGSARTARIAWILGGVLVVFAVWLALSANSGIAFFYAVPVGLAAWWFGGKAGFGVAFGCIAIYAIGAQLDHVSEFGLALAIRALALLGVAAVGAALHDRLLALEHSAEELDAIRAALTPSDLPDLPGVDAAAAFVPSELGVSGDFFLLTNGPDGSTLAIVGDVVGHGPKAARLATFVRAQLAAFAASTSDPAELLNLANTALVDRPGRHRELVSAVCLRMKPDETDICWAVAGHPPPLWLPGLDELSHETRTFLLGADAGLSLENSEISLGAREGVVVYTDGATDVRRDDKPLGLPGLARFFAPLAGLSARATVAEVEREILAWADRPIRDDLCLLVLKPEPAAPAAV